MSTKAPCADETANELKTDVEGSIRYWLDDELLDNIADIINENFVLEVKASLNPRN